VRRLRDPRGSAAVELALSVPIVVLLLSVLLQVGLAAADLVTVQSLAREAARVAAVADDDAVRRALDAAAGDREVRLTLSPASPRSRGALVTAEVRVRSTVLGPLDAAIWLPGRAVMRVEDG